MPKEFIVAIELGSSKITGIAGRKNADGTISVQAVVKEDASLCIRKGVIYNIDKTVTALSNIIKKLETSLKTKVAQVYVGVGGQSIRSVKNTIVKELPADTIVNQDLVNELMDTNRSADYGEQEILDSITQEYKVDSQFQLDPVGIQCMRLEGNFLNILWRKAFYRNLNKCFDNAGIAIAEMYLAPLALAESILTMAEKRSGCLLVDFGADTTTVQVYHKNILRHIAVIPLGSNNITKDLATLQIDEKDAERIKVKYANALTDPSADFVAQPIAVDKERSISEQTFHDIVEARTAEIVENIWYQVPAELTDKLMGGIVLTGGGSNMKNIDAALRKHTCIDKVRIAKFVNTQIHSNNADINAKDGTMNTVLAILEKGDMNCAGAELNDSLFPHSEEKQTGDTGQPKSTRTFSDTSGTGIVLTEAEKQKAEEEARKKREAEEEARRKEEEEKRAEEERIRKENSLTNKLWQRTKGFFKDIVKEEE